MKYEAFHRTIQIATLAILTAVWCRGDDKEKPKEIEVPLTQPSPPAPLLSIGTNISIESASWLVETNYSQLPGLPRGQVDMGRVVGNGSQSITVSSNEYSIIRSGTQTNRFRTQSIPIFETNRTFRQLVVRIFADGSTEVVQ